MVQEELEQEVMRNLAILYCCLKDAERVGLKNSLTTSEVTEVLANFVVASIPKCMFFKSSIVHLIYQLHLKLENKQVNKCPQILRILLCNI